MNGNALGKLGLGGKINDNKMSISQAWVTLDIQVELKFWQLEIV